MFRSQNQFCVYDIKQMVEDIININKTMLQECDVAVSYTVLKSGQYGVYVRIVCRLPNMIQLNETRVIYSYYGVEQVKKFFVDIFENYLHIN